MCCRPSCSIGCMINIGCNSIFFLWFMTIIFFSDISPSQVKFYVTEASLMQFNLTNNTTLYYNFKVNITVRNPNKHIIVYYRVIRAIAWYKDNDFAYVSLTPFDQGHKNTSFLQPVVFEGHTLINLTTCQLGEYIEETRAGIYNLAVNLDLTMRMKFGWYKRSRFNPPIVQCSLIVPLISNGKSATPFNVIKCSPCDITNCDRICLQTFFCKLH